MTTIPDGKLSPNETIALLARAINTDNKESFYTVLEQYQRSLSPTGEMSLKIKRLLSEKPKQLSQLSDLPGEIKKLIIQKELPSECVYVNNKTNHFLNELLKEWRNAEIFKYHNLGVRNKILLHGPTGNGKTTTARHIARLTELPFIEINSDLIIDSRLGNTGENIYSIFNKITMPCVLFWDEVDTIGRARGKGNDSAAGLENERMINSILINIEKLRSEVIFIGATNRREVLDKAFLRRFDCEVELGDPTEAEKYTFASQLFDYYKLPFDQYDTSQFKNFSEIKRDLTERARKYILSEIENRKESSDVENDIEDYLERLNNRVLE